MKLNIITKVPKANGNGPHVITLGGESLKEIAEQFDTFLSPNAVEYMEFVTRNSAFDGHNFDNSTGRVKYTETEEMIIKELIKGGTPLTKIVEITGMTHGMIERRAKALRGTGKGCSSETKGQVG